MADAPPASAMADAPPTPPRLPTQQLAILAVARFAEPLAYTSIFPYLPEMIADFGVEQNQVAKWAGLTAATFSLAQAASAVPWGKAADRFGRKPILICGLCSTMVGFVVWGMSTSLAMAMTVRALLGAGNGNVGIIRTMVAEMVPEKELQPRAFSVMPLVWSLGSVLGPAFGGFFAQPARRYPALFAGIDYFRRFPYALPNLIATLFFLVSAASAALFLKETLASKKGRRDWGLLVGERLARPFRRRRASLVDGEATAPLVPSKVHAASAKREAAPAPGLAAVFTRQTVTNLAAYTLLAFHSVAYDQNITVFLNYPRVEHTPDNTRLPFYFNGGFGFKSATIGTLFTAYGITCGLIQFLLYPPLVQRYGVLRCFRLCSVMLPFVYLATPYTSLLPTEAGRLAALMAVMAAKGFAIIIAFPSTTILLTNSCTSLRVLGTLNGFATAFSGLGRGFGPGLTGLAFTWGADHGYVVSAYFFLAAAALAGAVPAFMIVEGDGPADDADAARQGSEHARRASETGRAADDDDARHDADAAMPLLGPATPHQTYQSMRANRT